MKQLDRVYIEISNICNLQCTFCPVVERDKQVMSFDDFKKVIEDAAPLAKQVCLHLMGEPLAHPEFQKIVEYCESLNVLIQITTNGLLAKKYKDLLCSPTIRQINFSVQSYKDNFPERPIEDYMRSLLEFCDHLRSNNENTFINFRLWNLGDKSFENENVISYLERYFDVSINRNVDVGFKKSKKVVEKIYLHFDSRFEWPSFDLPYQSDKGRCHGVVGHVGIHADGKVVPCCLDKEANVVLGNVFETSLKDILLSKRASDMRDGFNKGIRVEKFCQHCSFANRF
ncbi:radical SAM/SPASM domain-containing protein [Bacteriovorax sp. Seq25_V]|uniref:radical SAM/SPASM domain-containing protein n=1 Tax=Bacteriovorax sp. Seq25_V TaxID=1201288 RepID=UPI00038A41AD|nr:radical SAM protein [Bacteriovorax sp. Seq25_V]EQC47192.1 SPASM domain protein [Bacteriovorax sp. Seq25_V]